MIKEILSYYNLSCEPFSKEIKTEKLQVLPSIEKTLKGLEMLIETKGIGVITGKSGTGKSCIIRLLKDKLNTGLYKPVYMCHTSVTLLEFYIHLCSGLGLQQSSRKAMMFQNVKDRLLTLNKSNRIHPILIIDEAHLLDYSILQEIRLLTNFEIDSYSGLTVIFCGQESFNLKLGLTILEPLANSVTFSFNIDSLNKDETFSYIEKRIIDSGCSNPLFTKGALTLIHQASGGVIRTINAIANSSLIKAYYTKSASVEVEHVNSVINR
jgi:type II secretory pathway predicted ATPase ExeA